MIESDYLYQFDVVLLFENICWVIWYGEVRCDDFFVGICNCLGLMLMLFCIFDFVVVELEIVLFGKGGDFIVGWEDEEQQDSEFDVLQCYREEVEEFIKDWVSWLVFEEMEELVVGLLCVMGYCICVSLIGLDWGVDIMVLFDGFGFELLRIMVEVKYWLNMVMGL